jgi:fructokinase
LESIGIGSFGPIDLNPRSAKFGYITSTPKSGWSDTDFAGAVRRGTGLPVASSTKIAA